MVENPLIAVVVDNADCRSKLFSFIPNLVVSDYKLPDGTGIEILEFNTVTG